MCCNSRRKNQTFFYATSSKALDNKLALPQNSQHSTAQHSTAQYSTALAITLPETLFRATRVLKRFRNKVTATIRAVKFGRLRPKGMTQNQTLQLSHTEKLPMMQDLLSICLTASPRNMVFLLKKVKLAGLTSSLKKQVFLCLA